jgi:hypothetical protein
MSRSALAIASAHRRARLAACLFLVAACGESGAGSGPADVARDGGRGGAGGAGADATADTGGVSMTTPDAGSPGGAPDAEIGGTATLDGGASPDGGADAAGGMGTADARGMPPVFGTCGAVEGLEAAAQVTPTGWHLEGTSARAAQTAVGSCGGDGREMAYAFVAPEPGEYTFAARAADPGGGGVPFAPVVYVRRVCDDPTSELACDAGATAGEGAPSAVTRLLATDEPIIVFVDAADAFTGGAFTLDVTLDRPGAPGEACDPDGGPNNCAPELRCLAVGGDTRCRIVAAPSISAARLIVEPVAGTLGLRLDGLDPGDDVTGLVLEAVDAAGAVVPLGPQPPGGVRPFTALVQAGGRFEGAFSLRAVAGVGASPLGRISAVTVEVLDAAGLRSAPLRIEATPAPRLGPGEVCDPDRIFDACADGLLCDDGVCAMPAVDCPPAFAAEALRDGLTLAGDTRRAADVATAPCGGSGGDAVYRLTAETAGFYVVEAWSADRRVVPLIFARSACGAEDPAASLGCAAPDGDDRAQLGLDLAAGETVSVFVTGVDAEAGGAFSVRTLRPEPPVLDAAEVFVNPETRALGVRADGRDRDGDVRALGVRLFDAAGVDLLGDAAPADLPLAAGEVTLRPGGVVAVRAARRLALDAARITHVEVSLVDAYGGRSAALSVEVRPTPAAARGEVCDVDGAFAACVAPDRCGGPLARVPRSRRGLPRALRRLSGRTR